MAVVPARVGATGMPIGRSLHHPCAYVRYNFGATFHDEADVESDDARARDLYAEAGRYFENAMVLLRPCLNTGLVGRTHCRLLPEAMQNQAYGLAKQAELNPEPSIDEVTAVSRKSDDAVEAWRLLDVDPPPHRLLTAARVRLLRREWSEAAEQLKRLRDSGEYGAGLPPLSKAELHLLLAAAQAWLWSRSWRAEWPISTRLEQFLSRMRKTQVREDVAAALLLRAGRGLRCQVD